MYEKVLNTEPVDLLLYMDLNWVFAEESSTYIRWDVRQVQPAEVLVASQQQSSQHVAVDQDMNTFHLVYRQLLLLATTVTSWHRSYCRWYWQWHCSISFIDHNDNVILQLRADDDDDSMEMRSLADVMALYDDWSDINTQIIYNPQPQWTTTTRPTIWRHPLEVVRNEDN